MNSQSIMLIGGQLREDQLPSKALEGVAKRVWAAEVS